MLKKVLKTQKNQDCKILSSPSGELMYVMHLLHGEIEKRLDAVLTKEKGLSLSQYLVLVGFSNNGDLLSQAKLAEKLRLTEATVSRHIGILVTKKLLERKKEAGNKKSYSLSLTPHGAQVFHNTEDLLLKTMDTLLLTLSTKEKLGVSTELKKVIAALQHN